MELLLVGIYAFFVWLIFIKLKLLPWTTPWKVAVIIFPVVVLVSTILLLNIFAPTTTDVRVIKYTVPIVSQVRGRVIEVPVENNRPVKKGDVLFRIDPTPYESEVQSLEAQLKSEEAKVGAEQARLAEMQARLPDAVAGERQLGEQLNQATGQMTSLQASLELARKTGGAEHGARRHRRRQSFRSGAGADQRQRAHGADRRGARGGTTGEGEAVWPGQGGPCDGGGGQSADRDGSGAGAGRPGAGRDARAQLENARWNLQETTVRAPANGTMVNVMLRPGFFVAGMPFNEVMTFVDTEYQIFALFNQNELHQIAPGNEAEITLDTYPGRIIKAHVDSVIWAQSQGQLDASGNLPVTMFAAPPGRFPVKLVVAEKDHALFLAAGARGATAIYTEHLTLIHLIRKVLLRTSSYLDYIIIKHHISLH